MYRPSLRFLARLLAKGLAFLLCTLANGLWAQPAKRPTQTLASPAAPPVLPAPLQAALSQWLATHGQDPVAYTISLFRHRDVVFLGEQHRVKHDVLFVQSLLEPLYRAGVRILATEFGRREDQPLIDWLLMRAEWDEAIGREIVFRQFSGWGYQEYVDLYRAAWALNRRLPAGATPMRILGLNDSPEWSLVKSPEDREDPKIKRQVWKGGGEHHWARVILEAVGAGEKVIVYSGIHHAFTRYRQPIVERGRFIGFDPDLRAGNHVFAAIGERAATVFLHAPWSGPSGFGSKSVHPADGILDSLMLAEGPRAVGFDLSPGPFGDLALGGTVYAHGHESFTLGQFCDGWIYTQPISAYQGVTPIEGWIHPGNLSRARMRSPDPADRSATLERFNHSLRESADLRSRWGHLK